MRMNLLTTQSIILFRSHQIMLLDCLIKKNKKLKEWITQGLIISIKNRNRLSIKLQKRPFDRDLKFKFTRYRNLLNILIRKAKMLHYQNKIITAGKDSKEIWRILNNFTGRKSNK